MQTSTKVLLGVLASVIVLVIGVVSFFLSAKFTAAKYENDIVAVYEDMQNVYANQIVQVLKGKSQVIQQYKGDFTEVVKLNMDRYKNDQNLMFKAIVEQAGLKLSDDLYKDLSKSIEIAYTKFENKQRAKIDTVRVYKNFLDGSIKGAIAKFFGYPSEKALFVMNKLITNVATTETFNSGNMEQLDLFDKNKK